MDNITTNEQLRKKWNAAKGAKEVEVGFWDKFKHYYFGPDHASRVQRYFEIRDREVDRLRMESRGESLASL